MKLVRRWRLTLAAVGVLTAVGLALAGKALTEKERALPPTGAAPALPGPQAAMPAGSAAARWDRLSASDLESALEEREDAADLLQFMRVRLQPDQEIAAPFPPLPVPATNQAAPTTAPPAVASPPALAEPTIQQVQQAAIRYAEVMPEKIGRWRWLAQLRNFIPRFSIDLDRDRDRTIASSTSAGKTTFTVGPEDESVSMDFGLSWDLANLVWDPAQTSIDTRSRLMVQLRQEVLKEATGLYFQRQRLLAEFQAQPTDDPLLQNERELRLAELAAQLDALTGGLYSPDR